MANKDQKTILLEYTYGRIKENCIKFQENSWDSYEEVKTLIRELARFLGKGIKWKIAFSLLH